MSQITTGVRSILSHAKVFSFVQWLLGGDRVRLYLAQRILQHQPRRLLDIGCGTGEILKFLPGVDYYGFDLSHEYIQSAQRRFGDRGHFFQLQIDANTQLDYGTFDCALCIGLLHHLDDDAAQNLLSVVSGLLNPGGFLLAIDPVFAPGMHWLARWLISRDRGQNVRTQQGYRELAQPYFAEAQCEYRRNLLNIPYSHNLLIGRP